MSMNLLGGTLTVEISWTATLSSNESAWVWTDITADVMDDNRLSIRQGRSDESSKTNPATCRFTVNNATSKYSLGAHSPNYPNVKRGRPVRVKFNSTVLFVGFLAEMEPGWDTSARVATVEITAAGSLRRTEQHKTPMRSPLYRSIEQNSSGLVAHWPVEEGSDAYYAENTSTTRAPLTPIINNSTAPPLHRQAGGVPMDFASNDEFPGSDDIATLDGVYSRASLPPYSFTGTYTVYFLWSFTQEETDRWASGYSTGSYFPALVVGAGGTSSLVLYYDPTPGAGGDLKIGIWTGAAFAESAWINSNLNGHPAVVGFTVTQNGANVDWSMRWYKLTGSTTGIANGTIAGTSLVVPTQIDVNPGVVGIAPTFDKVGFGHLSFWNTLKGLNVYSAAVWGHLGEEYTARMARLSTETSIQTTLYSTTAPESTDLKQMGYQSRVSAVDALREAEEADGGILFDGYDKGVLYRRRVAIENQTTRLTLAANQLQGPPRPVYDDANLTNKVTVKRRDGGEATAEVTSGQSGTVEAGLYNSEYTLNLANDSVLSSIAWWRVRHGTLDGYRYPQASFRVTTTNVASVAALRPGERVVITDVSVEAEQHPGGDIDLLVQGFTHTIGNKTWVTTLNASPYDQWRIGVVSATSGDTGEFVARVDTDGATLASPAALGATSLSVASTGALWTTVADDFPLKVEVGGTVVTVTGISGASSPQTFTVQPTARSLAAGLPVSLWHPPVLGL